MNGYTFTGIHVVCYKSEPDIYKQELKSDSLSPDPSEYYVVLGHIEVKTSVWNLDFPPSAAWLVEGQYVKWALNSQGSKTLSVKIIWSLKGGNASRFPKYNIYVEKKPNISVDERQEYIGVAEVEAFYVSDLVVPFGFSSLRFIVQICSLDGTSQKLDDSPSFLLPVEVDLCTSREILYGQTLSYGVAFTRMLLNWKKTRVNEMGSQYVSKTLSLLKLMHEVYMPNIDFLEENDDEVDLT